MNSPVCFNLARSLGRFLFIFMTIILVVTSSVQASSFAGRKNPPQPAIINFPSKPIFTGMYDYNNVFAGIRFDLSHEFVSWNDGRALEKAFQLAQQRQEFPLITIEPVIKKGLTKETFLPDISNGLYEQEIKLMAQGIQSHAPQQVLIRWGHEMDICNSYYAWSSCVAADYIAAYQHVVNSFRQQGVNNVLWVWSPAGNNNAPEFYPGDTYVDFVGMTLLVSEDWDRLFGNALPNPQDMAQAFAPRYQLLAQFNKPIMIAEFGISYSDPKTDRTLWLTNGFLTVNRTNFPLFVGWVYYNKLCTPTSNLPFYPNFSITKNELLTALTNSGN